MCIAFIMTSPAETPTGLSRLQKFRSNMTAEQTAYYREEDAASKRLKRALQNIDRIVKSISPESIKRQQRRERMSAEQRQQINEQRRLARVNAALEAITTSTTEVSAAVDNILSNRLQDAVPSNDTSNNAMEEAVEG